MKQRIIMGVAISSAVFLGLNKKSQSSDLQNDKSSKPNIVLIVSDDQGYADASFQNHHPKEVSTPAIDKLIGEGITFTGAHASASVYTPSKYDLLTGRYAFRTEDASQGIWGFHNPVIETERETLASVLKKDGYTTAFIGKWHLGLGWQTKDGKEPVLDARSGKTNGHIINDPQTMKLWEREYELGWEIRI